jgi:hypothetical protein
VRNYFKCHFARCSAGTAIADACHVVLPELLMEGDEHFSGLLGDFFRLQFFANPVKENCIALDFGNLHSYLVRFDQCLEQFLDDGLTVIGLYRIHKLSEATDVRYKKKSGLRCVDSFSHGWFFPFGKLEDQMKVRKHFSYGLQDVNAE